MKVFKFGGASVKCANSVRNVSEIVGAFSNHELVVVISAMGKTTNSLERLINSFCYKKEEVKPALKQIVDYHSEILGDLFPNRSHKVYARVNELLCQLEDLLNKDLGTNYDEIYDQFICYGELLSTTIITYYLLDEGIENKWLDARELIKTDEFYRQAAVNWEQTQSIIKEKVGGYSLVVTQGFIGSTNKGNTTSLGREGSDFTASIFAYSLQAEDVTIWKDVPGMLNADPKYYPHAKKLEKISYREAIELSYYGASVIHPKTVKPLQNKQIPLYIKSFLNPSKKGSVIQESNEFDKILPSFIFTTNQILISISPRDFSFVAENNLQQIFTSLFKLGIKVNLMQNSALRFSICVKNEERKIALLLKDLENNYQVLFNKDVTLFTIRHYNEEAIKKVIEEKQILLEQRTRTTARFVFK